MTFFKSRMFSIVMLIMLFLLLMVTPVLAEGMGEENTLKNESEKPAEEVTKLVFYIVVDGLQNQSLLNNSMANMKGLAVSGIQADKVTTVYPDDSNTVLTSILTGCFPTNNKETKNQLENKNIFSYMESKGIKTSFFDGSDKFDKFKKSISFMDKVKFQNKDDSVVDAVIRHLNQSNTYFNVIMLSQLRASYENYGVNSSQYAEQLKKTDNEVGKLFRYLHAKGLYDNSVIVVSGTCGEPPLILKGPQLKAGEKIPPVNITDISPTIAYLLGINMSQIEGNVIYNAFKAKEDRSERFLLTKRVEDLSKSYGKSLEEKRKMEMEKQQLNIQQKKVAAEKQKIQKEISDREDKIKSLSNKILLMKLSGIIITILFIFGFYVEYKFLRKKFLMF